MRGLNPHPFFFGLFGVLIVTAAINGCGVKRSVEPPPSALLSNVMKETLSLPSQKVRKCSSQESQAHSPSSAFLAIEEAVSEALKNNPDLHFQQLNPVIQGSFEIIEQASFDPEIFVELISSREEKFSSQNMEDAVVIKDRLEEGRTGIRKRFLTGTEIETTLSHGRYHSEGEADYRKTRVGVSLTQALLKGFGVQVNQIKIRQARLDGEISAQELRGFVETLVAQTEIAYWRYVLSKQKIPRSLS